MHVRNSHRAWRKSSSIAAMESSYGSNIRPSIPMISSKGITVPKFDITTTRSTVSIFFSRAADGNVSAAMFFCIRLKVGNRNFRVFLYSIRDNLHPVTQSALHALIQLYPFTRQPRGFADGVAIAGQRGERRKLRRAIRNRHVRARRGDMVRQIYDVVIRLRHALCPPIWRLRSIAVAPSFRFIPRKMAFFPCFFLISSIVFCILLSRASSVSSASFFIRTAV